MKFRKAIIENSKEELKAYSDNMKNPIPMYNPTDGVSSNAAETTISGRPSDPDNEQLVIQIEKYCMFGNFEAAESLMRKSYDKLTLADINRLVQFSKFIAGDTIRNLAAKKKKPDFEKFGPKFIKTVRSKMVPK